MASPTAAVEVAYWLPASSLHSSHLMFDPSALDHCEIDTLDLRRSYRGQDPRRLPQEWLALLERQRSLGDGPVLVQTFRNLVQNLGCPGYSRDYGVVQAASEHVERRRRPYHGVSFLSDGRVRADSLRLSEPPPTDVEQLDRKSVV